MVSSGREPRFPSPGCRSSVTNTQVVERKTPESGAVSLRSIRSQVPRWAFHMKIFTVSMRPVMDSSTFPSPSPSREPKKTFAKAPSGVIRSESPVANHQMGWESTSVGLSSASLFQSPAMSSATSGFSF